MAEAKRSYSQLKSELDSILSELQHEDTDVDKALELHKRGQVVLKELDTYLDKAASEGGIKKLSSKDA